jgi:CO/xanthine dehydrogenase FAD-binding subunit
MLAASPISDTRGSADYRRELIGVLTKRVVIASLGQLGAEVGVA